jgi:hypothetical protein
LSRRKAEGLKDPGGIQPLAGEELLRGQGAGTGADRPEGKIFNRSGGTAAGIACHRGAAQVVLVNPLS